MAVCASMNGTTDAAPGPEWMPARVREGRVEWVRLGAAPLRQPFYEMDVRMAGWADRERRVTRLEDLPAHAAAVPALEPSGFVFHMSRCGSTLTAKVLGAPESHLAVSEAPPLDAVVRRRDPELLRAMVRALGRVRRPGQARLFVKLDCWHILDLALFREAFPETPWVFLHRDPGEVLASHAREAGVQMVAEYFPPAFWGLGKVERPFGPAWQAQVLGVICRAGLNGLKLGGGLAVNYRELPEALFGRVLPHFGVRADATDLAAMRDASRLDAKAPSPTAFRPRQEKHAEAIGDERLLEAYAALEALSRPASAPPPPRP